MLRVGVFAGGTIEDFSRDFDLYVGVDRGALFLLENDLPLSMAFGDFDSVGQEELERIEAASGFFLKAPPEKDDTDLELALKEIFKTYPEAEVRIFGAFGGRLDHTLSNVFLPSNPAIHPFLRQLTLVDKQNLLCYFPEGKNEIKEREGFAYVAFMAEQEAQLTIEGAKYELDISNFFERKIYGSNEFVGRPIEVSCPAGYLVVIYSKDRS